MADSTQNIKVRQVTNVHTNWSEGESGAPGKLSFQLILDNGAEEYVMRPTPSDAKVLLKLIGSSDSIFFDLDRKVFIPHSIK